MRFNTPSVNVPSSFRSENVTGMPDLLTDTETCKPLPKSSSKGLGINVAYTPSRTQMFLTAAFYMSMFLAAVMGSAGLNAMRFCPLPRS